MCGIAGFWGPESEADLFSMLAAQAYRGPDGRSSTFDANLQVRLGHNRLAVLDITGGGQPMGNEDDAVVVVFNGEIYNHRELRKDLENLGHRFRSDHSDTEVIVHGYEQWGADLPTRLNGMFAFAILDRRRRLLFFARDRFGKKPLFYSATPNGFIFASELGAIQKHPRVNAEPDRLALQKFMAYGYFPAPFTPLKSVRKLPGGHTMAVDLATGAVRIERYWQYKIKPYSPPSGTEADWAAELRHLLIQAVERRLESDVPLGFFLSGGLDSSAILACAAQHLPASELTAYSIGFTDPSFDESSYARTMAKQVGCRHELEICNLAAARENVLPLLRRLGEPIGDSSILSTWLLSRHARQHVTVALSGDGGDELFAGYDPFIALRPSSLYRHLVPSALTPFLRRAARLLPKSDRNMSFDTVVSRWLRGVEAEPPLWIPLWMSPLAPEHIAQWFGTPVDEEELYSEAIEAWNSCASSNPVDQASEFFVKLYLQEDVLVKVDRAAMQEGLEVRSPFLDNDLVDFSCRLPARAKMRGNRRKVLLKQAVKGLVPDTIAHRAKKGFGVPIAKWLRTWPQPERMDSVPFIDPKAVESMWTAHRAGRDNHGMALWCWMSLQAQFTPG